ncbi:Asx homology domain-containing protein [Bombardia bombarda]|uniref:Asx homology domain-containing protein n=1 Tax=Bombardia bombarda TaxID=252184 RepID=A0AA39XJY0_9PEZI|nr:Asx homology domain-containing protein [Bombardia bombarda]
MASDGGSSPLSSAPPSSHTGGTTISDSSDGPVLDCIEATPSSQGHSESVYSQDEDASGEEINSGSQDPKEFSNSTTEQTSSSSSSSSSLTSVRLSRRNRRASSEQSIMTQDTTESRQANTRKRKASAAVAQTPDPPSKKRILLKNNVPRKSAPSTPRKTATSRKTAKQKKWEAPFVITDKKSPLVDVDLRKLLLLPQAWDILTPAEKMDILARFPDDTHILDAGTTNARPNVLSLRNDDSFRNDCSRYCENIGHGRHDDAWLQEAWVAHEKHRRGDFNDYLDQKFEDDWNVDLPEEHRAQRGGSTSSNRPKAASTESPVPSASPSSSIRGRPARAVKGVQGTVNGPRDNGATKKPTQDRGFLGVTLSASETFQSMRLTDGADELMDELLYGPQDGEEGSFDASHSGSGSDDDTEDGQEEGLYPEQQHGDEKEQEQQQGRNILLGSPVPSSNDASDTLADQSSRTEQQTSEGLLSEGGISLKAETPITPRSGSASLDPAQKHPPLGDGTNRALGEQTNQDESIKVESQETAEIA